MSCESFISVRRECDFVYVDQINFTAEYVKIACCPDMSFYTSNIGKLSILCPEIKDFGYNLGLVDQMPKGEMRKMAGVRALLPQLSLLASMSL